jgi:hypothetical protein
MRSAIGAAGRFPRDGVMGRAGKFPVVDMGQVGLGLCGECIRKSGGWPGTKPLSARNGSGGFLWEATSPGTNDGRAQATYLFDYCKMQASQTIARMAKLADARDLKSRVLNGT